MTDKQFVAWREFDGQVYSMAQDIKRDIVPDVIVGVARGGLPGAVMLSHALNARFEVIEADHYEGMEQQEKVVITDYALGGINEGEKVLLFDDIVDSGETMLDIIHTWEKQDIVDFAFRTASMHVKPGARMLPDYWREETDRWVVYPWEVTA